jgi:hypothetical protein
MWRRLHNERENYYCYFGRLSSEMINAAHKK